MSTQMGATGVDRETHDTSRLFHHLMECSPLPFVATEGLKHIVRYINPAFCHLVEKEREELIGRPFAQAVPEGEENGCFALLDRVYRTGTTETLADQEHSHPHSHPLYWSYVTWAVLTAEGQTAGVMIQVTDTTRIALLQRQMTAVNQELLLSSMRQQELTEVAEGLNTQLQALATTDGLTGLQNHRTFHERLKEEMERATRYGVPLSLLFLDVDHFKHHNDTYGHPAGDVVLRKIGEVLHATARTNDLVARYGGEEFAVILPETDEERATVAAERFRAAIEGAGWQEWHITVSVGAATLSRNTRDSTTLIEQADKALYCSKERGRNYVTHIADIAPAIDRDAPARTPSMPRTQ